MTPQLPSKLGLSQVVFATLFALTGGAFGQSNLPPCPTTVEKRDCTGTWTSPSGKVYRGEFKGNKFIGESIDNVRIDVEVTGGQPNGRGTFGKPDGWQYVGEFRDGIFHGQGDMSYPDGAKYVGEFRGGKRHGQGTYTFPTGEKYVGEFRDNKQHGQGTHTWPDGEKHVGEWRDGERNGQGTHTFPNGAKYVGEYRDGKRNGQGTYTDPNGAKYVGEYRDGSMNGQGTFTFPHGEKYVGEWRDGKEHGQGTLTFPNGAKYVGEWRDGKPNGQGIRYATNGSILESGRWEGGALVEDSTAIERWIQYQKRQKTLLEQVLNYTTTTLEDGSASEFWISGANGQHKCVLKRYSAPASQARSLTVEGVFEAMARRMSNPSEIDLRMFNPSGFRIRTFNNGTVIVGDENMKISGDENTVTDRLRKGWGLALQECQPAQRRAF